MCRNQNKPHSAVLLSILSIEQRADELLESMGAQRELIIIEPSKTQQVFSKTYRSVPDLRFVG